MTFQSLQQNKSGPSPAVELHTRYGRLTNGKSKIGDWRNLLQRDFSFDELSSLINWLEVHRAGAFPSSTTILRNIKDMLAESKNDPVACRINVSMMAMDMAMMSHNNYNHRGGVVVVNDNHRGGVGHVNHYGGVNHHAGHPVEPELVQDALDKYREYLASRPPEFDFLDSPSTFVHDWFVVRARYGSPRMRRFHFEHVKFKEYIALVKRAMERG